MYPLTALRRRKTVRVWSVPSMPFRSTRLDACSVCLRPSTKISASAVNDAVNERRPGGTENVAVASPSAVSVNGWITLLLTLPSPSVDDSLSDTLLSAERGAGMLPCSSRRGRTSICAA